VTTYAGLLRAVNVAGRGKLAMSALRSMVIELGYTDVTTYIQSGNVVFDSTQRSPAKIEAAIEGGLEVFGLDTPVMVRNTEELRRIVDANPFARQELSPTQLVVVFLKTKASRQGPIDTSTYGPEHVIADGRELFIHYPNGQGRSKLTNAVIEREIGSRGTARNWNTVNKLLALAEPGGRGQ
jgi:uncharacterized protein (DUF1697 family)